MSNHRRQSINSLVRGSLAYGLLPMVGLITAPMLARVLGPNGRGQLAAVLQPLTVLEAIILAGAPIAVTYFVGTGLNFRDIRRYVCFISTIAACFSLVIAVVYSSEIAQTANLNRGFVFGVWCTSILTLVIGIRRAVLQGRGRLDRINVERCALALLRLGLIVLLVALGVRVVEPYILAALVPGFVAAIALLLPSRTQEADRSTQKPTESVNGSKFYTFALLAGSGHIAITINSRLDQAVLPVFLNTNELGLYAVAVTIAELPLIMTLVITRNLLSEASRGFTTKELLTTAGIGSILVALVSLGLWLAAPSATVLLFGDQFSGAADIARLLLVGTTFVSVTSAMGAILAGIGKPGSGIISPTAGIVVIISGFLALGENLNIYDASLVVLASRLLTAIVAVVVASMTLRNRARKQINAYQFSP